LQGGFRYTAAEGVLFIAKLASYVVWAMSVKRKSTAWEYEGGRQHEYNIQPVELFGAIAGHDQGKCNASAIAVLVHTLLEFWHERALLNLKVQLRVGVKGSRVRGDDGCYVESRLRYWLRMRWKWWSRAVSVVAEQVQKMFLTCSANRCFTCFFLIEQSIWDVSTWFYMVLIVASFVCWWVNGIVPSWQVGISILLMVVRYFIATVWCFSSPE
jgi:hypothetical protein